MMYTRYMIAALTACALLFSCKKSPNNTGSNTNNSHSFSLDTITVSGNTVLLKWTPLKNDSLVYYQILKEYDTSKYPRGENVVVAKTDTTYVDTFEVARFVRYTIVGMFKSGTRVLSNSRVFVRPDLSFFPDAPTKFLFDNVNHQIFLTQQYGPTSVYSIQQRRITKTLAMDMTNGVLGDYNGKKELYLWQNGSVLVYDAATMDAIDSLNVKGVPETFVGGYLVLSVYDGTTRPSKGLLCSRATRQITDSFGWPMEQYCIGANGDNVFFYDQGSTRCGKIAPDGKISYGQWGAFANASDKLYDVFPSGNLFVTTNKANIYDTLIHNTATLPGLDYYTIARCFAFNSAQNFIYAGTSKRLIYKYDMTTYQLLDSIHTAGDPLFLFYDNGTTVSISSPDPIYSSYVDSWFIEQH